MIYLNLETGICKLNVTNLELMKGKYEIKKEFDELNKIIDNIMNDFQENIILKNEVLNEKNIEIKGSDTDIMIGKIKNINLTNYQDLLAFDYKQCLKILNIELISDIDYENYLNYEYKYINYSKSGINKIDYYIYTPKDLLNLLNLSECFNKTKKISYLNAHKDDKNSLILQFLKNRHDIFNKSSPLYNNYCYSFSYLNKSDLTLYGRISYLLKEYGYICRECDYRGKDEINYEVSCFCNNKTDINTKIEEEDNIDGLKKITKFENIQILKCYKLAFSKKEQKIIIFQRLF